jgi:hypothetical protein
LTQNERPILDGMALVSPIKIRYKGYNEGDKMKNKIIKNKKMSPETYKLKRAVVDIIYKAKRMTQLPWIEVKVGDATAGNEATLGLAKLRANQLWITEKAINYGSEKLTHVVLHEVLHAVYGKDHDESCPLMSACLPAKPLSQDECYRHFIKHIK